MAERLLARWPINPPVSRMVGSLAHSG
jgi:hypothetical protein